MVMKSRGEFGFIDFIRSNFPSPEGAVGIGDDCAVIPAGEGELLFSTDILMEGVHFLRNESSPEDVGWKAAAVNLSDIAAMGGTPVATFLSIALPKDSPHRGGPAPADTSSRIRIDPHTPSGTHRPRAGGRPPDGRR